MDININLSGFSDEQKNELLRLLLDSDDQNKSVIEGEMGNFPFESENESESDMADYDTPEELPDEIILEEGQDFELSFLDDVNVS